MSQPEVLKLANSAVWVLRERDMVPLSLVSEGSHRVSVVLRSPEGENYMLTIERMGGSNDAPGT